jgi:hypothetical protein
VVPAIYRLRNTWQAENQEETFEQKTLVT